MSPAYSRRWRHQYRESTSAWTTHTTSTPRDRNTKPSRSKFAMIYVTFVTPYEVVYLHVNIGDPLFWLDRTADLCFFGHMVLQFFLTYKVKNATGEVWVTNVQEITKNYLRGWFMIDFFAIFPWWVFQQACDTSVSYQCVEAEVSLFRNVRLLRLFRLLRLARVGDMISEVSKSHLAEFSQASSSLLKFLCMLLVGSHFAACMWGFVGLTRMDIFGIPHYYRNPNLIKDPISWPAAGFENASVIPAGLYGTRRRRLGSTAGASSAPHEEQKSPESTSRAHVLAAETSTISSEEQEPNGRSSSAWETEQKDQRISAWERLQPPPLAVEELDSFFSDVHFQSDEGHLRRFLESRQSEHLFRNLGRVLFEKGEGDNNVKQGSHDLAVDGLTGNE
ncbi:unnamed protein product, partial [Amoebophrya sp. A25]|eukprot:GSA25T00026761001.1